MWGLSLHYQQWYRSLEFKKVKGLFTKLNMEALPREMHTTGAKEGLGICQKLLLGTN